MQPQDELELNKKLKDERDESDDSYAPIIIKTIVFGFIAAICLAFIAYLTKLAWPH